ncbi:hypothetical protein PKB_1291 [Pseudomonas knackmussii B13]|uniref:Uncharacterized protein n=1 Tax=Pseudomonas knackmussii (strain DSM 6978 / CCUG 54928 / LMG 23759 / B13) TaxID=1301098 RepID=A0A024HCT6_PSEKB|nr:hypothetical protein [Pseudomonas knackmussii]CDF82656.1 hypothetical protein PKB_1291 [Pseudomonas knackmussii B13]
MNDEMNILDLGEVRWWGHSIHGLAMVGSSSPVYKASGLQFALPAEIAGSLVDATVGIPNEDQGNVHLVKVPGIAELDIAEEEVAAELQEGRVWQNYALLSGPKQALAGQALKGWVCIDPANKRWLVKPTGTPSLRYGSIAAGGSLSLSFDITPFGYVGDPVAAPVSIGGILGALGQENPPDLVAPNGSMLVMRISSIASHGRSVVIALMPNRTLPADIRDLPYGFLQLDLVGNGPNFTVALSVLHTRIETFGDRHNQTVGDIPFNWRIRPQFKGTVLVEERDASGNLLHGEAIYEPIPFTPLQVGTPGWQYGHSTTAFYFSIGSNAGQAYLKNRLVSVVFDENNNLVRTTIDWEKDSQMTYNTPEMTYSGSYKLVTGSAVTPSRSGTVTVALTLNASGTYTERMTHKRDGEEFSRCEFTAPVNVSYAYSVSLNVNDELLDGFTDLVFSPVGATARYMIGGPDSFHTIPPGDHWSNPLTLTYDGEVLKTHDLHWRGYGGAGNEPLPVQRVGMSVLMGDDDPYLRFDCNVVRLCNHASALRVERFEDRAATDPVWAKSKKAVATAGSAWVNPRTATDNVDRTRLTASFHPITHALNVDLDWSPTNRYRGTWI